MTSGTDWPPKRIARFVELWNAGHSASVMSAEMGVSRSAILGKAYRLRQSGVSLMSHPIGAQPSTKAARRIADIAKVRSAHGLTEWQARLYLLYLNRGYTMRESIKVAQEVNI